MADRVVTGRRLAQERERERRRVRLTPAQRGYGAAHKRLRAMWARLVSNGGVSCARCDMLIVPGEPWDLGHDDVDRGAYVGPEHRACNRSTAAVQRRRSRAW